MTVNFNVIFKRKRFKWLVTRRFKKYFNINYCRKGTYSNVLIEDNDNYIIKIFNTGIRFIIPDNTDNNIKDILNNFMLFINYNFKNSRIDFKESDKIGLDKGV